ncbi:MAG: hypothetical protein ACKVOU_03715 [Cytophagales bacterium]
MITADRIGTDPKLLYAFGEYAKFSQSQLPTELGEASGYNFLIPQQCLNFKYLIVSVQMFAADFQDDSFFCLTNVTQDTDSLNKFTAKYASNLIGDGSGINKQLLNAQTAVTDVPISKTEARIYTAVFDVSLLSMSGYNGPYISFYNSDLDNLKPLIEQLEIYGTNSEDYNFFFEVGSSLPYKLAAFHIASNGNTATELYNNIGAINFVNGAPLYYFRSAGLFTANKTTLSLYNNDFGAVQLQTNIQNTSSIAINNGDEIFTNSIMEIRVYN